ncbi:ketopantoate reductase PanE/ApbA C terminal-domain-containing protein [Jimgerdemannia flammicorona]|uniref:Ketopantoate reductase PanE/ApbA C terminal-domain-containing protein n=1 Tax=Jimgerdemannia flammicorona TaxID=994334 RepID=A0A433QK39_9FUNG|nr:ketopantoate reductase PanE/ApbA C terminal-domain-containing protein [Jimgerdemannia flammicorona]
MHFHVLGTGTIGCLIASYLRQSNHTVTLLLKNAQSLVAYRKNDGITYEKDGVATKIRDFDLELAGDAFGRRPFLSSAPHHTFAITTSADTDDPIENLVVTTKAYNAIDAVIPLTRRIGRQSTIIFLQNGMGVYEDLAKRCFPDGNTRPSFVVGVNTHGAYRSDAFHVIHAGWKGEIHLGVVPREEETMASETQSGFEAIQQDNPANDAHGHGGQSDIFVDTSAITPTNNDPSLLSSTSNITSSPSSHSSTASLDSTLIAFLKLPLNTYFEPWPMMQCRILEKLVINSCINPVTALLRCRNGDLVGRRQGGQLIQYVCDEAAEVIRASGLISDEHVIATRFRSDTLQRNVVRVCRNTAKNESSMLQDVRVRRITEVDYMNGYLSRLGKRFGIPTPVNDALVTMIKLQHRLAIKKDAKL